MNSRSKLTIQVVAVAAVALILGRFLPLQWQFDLTQWLAFGLLAMSLSLVWGRGAIFSFGQTLFFGVGAYTYSILSLGWSGRTLVAVVIAVLLGAALAALLGWFMFYGGIADVFIAVVTLSASLVTYTLINSTGSPKWNVMGVPIGGYNGLVAVPAIELFGRPMLAADMLSLTIAVIALTYLGMRIFLASQAGRRSVAVGVNEERAALLGYSPPFYRCVIFAVSGLIAALAGVLFASSEGSVTPTVFGIGLGGSLVVWAMAGGREYLMGGLVGAVLLNLLTSRAEDVAFGDFAPFAGRANLLLGIVVLIVVLLAPRGLLGVVDTLRPRGRDRQSPPAAPEVDNRVAQLGALITDAQARGSVGRAGAETDIVAQATGVTKNFGGYRAVEDVSVTVVPGEPVCILGPNGAGKSTLFNVVAGRLTPDAGAVTINGHKATRWSVWRRAQGGIGIKMQSPCIFGELSVQENLRLAIEAADHPLVDSTDEVIERLGFSGSLVYAGALPHGEQQVLEMAMIVLADPSIVMLDEPTAGMTVGETNALVSVVQQLAKDKAVLIIEHDMEFVRQLEFDILMMVNGKEFARGDIDSIRSLPGVREVYFGGATDD